MPLKGVGTTIRYTSPSSGRIVARKCPLRTTCSNTSNNPGSFTWASGIKSPIYCDNRLTLTAPEVRDVIEHEMARVIEEKYPECDVVMGTSTAGIAHAAISAHILGKPMGYVRSSSKTHGRNNRIEGKLEVGEKA